MDLGLAGARALVGGASRGLGAAVAATLVGEDARVGPPARSADNLAAHGAVVPVAGGMVRAFP